MPSVRDVVNKAQRIQDRNLRAGFKGSGLVFVTTQGVSRNTFAIAFALQDFSKSLDGFHLRKLGELTSLARSNFEAKVAKGRSGESGRGQGRGRQTGQFTFGSRGGGAFVGVFMKDETTGVSGFGYPNVAIADARTNYVWRTLEFGLRPNPNAVRGARLRRGKTPIAVEAPLGEHKLPARFGFTGPNRTSSRLVPLSDRAVPNIRAQYVRLYGRNRGVAKRTRERANGIEPMFFISDAIGVVAQTLPAGYRQLLSKSYRRVARR